MDDRRAQFLILVADICSCAIVAGFDVLLHLVDGTRLSGVPTRTEPTLGKGELDDTGYANAIQIDGVEVPLDQLVECTVRAS